MIKESIFHFKQFDVDQSQVAMKINTDGVLIGAIAESDHPGAILDIGTGSGVIALMLAQRFPTARIDAVEIDPASAKTAAQNFRKSPFSDRIDIHQGSFTDFFASHPDNQYDLIVSNPPFFIDSLKSKDSEKLVARHTNEVFFEELTQIVSKSLNVNGAFWIILPLSTAILVKNLVQKTGLYLSRTISLKSFIESDPHREILMFTRNDRNSETDTFVIYEKEREYSGQFKIALQDFFTIF